VVYGTHSASWAVNVPAYRAYTRCIEPANAANEGLIYDIVDNRSWGAWVRLRGVLSGFEWSIQPLYKITRSDAVHSARPPEFLAHEPICTLSHTAVEEGHLRMHALHHPVCCPEKSAQVIPPCCIHTPSPVAASFDTGHAACALGSLWASRVHIAHAQISIMLKRMSRR
jgi:hypothetical protein